MWLQNLFRNAPAATISRSVYVLLPFISFESLLVTGDSMTLPLRDRLGPAAFPPTQPRVPPPSCISLVPVVLYQLSGLQEPIRILVVLLSPVSSSKLGMPY